jgi:glycosyltransferase involved in cell wall biosynthesis
LREHRPAIVHTHNEGSRSWGMLLKVLNPRLRLVHAVHAHDTLTEFGPMARMLIDRLVDRHVAVAPAIADELAAAGLSRVTTITNGIDLARFKRPRPAAGTGGPRSVVCVGRFDPDVKGQDVLIEAVALCRRQGLPLTLTLAGPSGGPGHARLAALADAAGLGDAIRFELDRLDVETILAGHDLFALASRSEGFGLALVEAMAAGLPVVSTRTGGPALLVRDGDNGFLVPPGDAPALAAAMGRLATDPALAARLAEAGRRTAAGYGIAAMRARYHDLYRQIVAGAHAAPAEPRAVPGPVPTEAGRCTTSGIGRAGPMRDCPAPPVALSDRWQACCRRRSAMVGPSVAGSSGLPGRGSTRPSPWPARPRRCCASSTAPAG